MSLYIGLDILDWRGYIYGQHLKMLLNLLAGIRDLPTKKIIWTQISVVSKLRNPNLKTLPLLLTGVGLGMSI